MAMICKGEQCKGSKGLCKHEKMMLIVVIVVVHQ